MPAKKKKSGKLSKMTEEERLAYEEQKRLAEEEMKKKKEDMLTQFLKVNEAEKKMSYLGLHCLLRPVCLKTKDHYGNAPE